MHNAVMRKPLTVGILAETKNKWERRAPLTPKDVAWLIQRNIPVEVLSSSLRIFNDDSYKRAGAQIVNKFQKAQFILGVKEPIPSELLPGKVYFLFSHTIKGQSHNRPLLKDALKKKITLIDYECLKDKNGHRLAYFGRFAGVCGMIDSLHHLGKRLEVLKIKSPLIKIKKTLDYRSLRIAKQQLFRVAEEIREKGFPKELSPFVVGVTGHGNVSDGVQEILEVFRPVEVHPKDMNAFTKAKKTNRKQIYKIVLLREEKLRSKNMNGFYFEKYIKHPENFESNLDKYLPYISILVNCSYWDKRYPRLVPETMVRKLYSKKDFRLRFIGDISCDKNGSIEITKKVTDPENPVFIYNPKNMIVRDGFEGKGIAVMAVDNLPAEFSEDASDEFSSMVRDYVYQIALHGAADVTNHHALPKEVREAVIAEGGMLTKPFLYLSKFI